VKALALRLRENPRFASQLDDELIERLRISAPLHDVGKLGVPDRIIDKAPSAGLWLGQTDEGEMGFTSRG
jgi:HD-GYP domain-containing protein (c-di-GMP phosphodiesterase class II)